MEVGNERAGENWRHEGPASTTLTQAHVAQP